MPRELRGVEGELHRRLAVRGLGRDLCRGADGVAVGARHRLAGRLVHEGAHQLVGLAGQQVLVGDRVRDGHGVVGERHVRARLGVGRRGSDLGDVDRLVLVLDVGVDRHLDAVLEQALERDDGHVVYVVHLERELHLHGAGAGLGLEGGAGSGRVAVRVEQGLPRGLVHEGAVDGVLAARLQVLVPDRVGERHVVVALGDVGSLASGQLGLDARAGAVVDGAAVDVGAVARHRDRERHELEPLVGGHAQLLHPVGVEGQGPQAVDRVGGDVGRACEPHARVGVERGLVDRAVGGHRRVVGVGALGVRVPGAGRVNLPVGVGDDDVGLPGGLGGDEERDARETVHAALAHLHEVQVAADDLVVDGLLGRVQQRHRAVLADLEGARPLLVQEVAPRGLGLAHHVGAVGQAV